MIHGRGHVGATLGSPHAWVNTLLAVASSLVTVRPHTHPSHDRSHGISRCRTISHGINLVSRPNVPLYLPRVPPRFPNTTRCVQPCSVPFDVVCGIMSASHGLKPKAGFGPLRPRTSQGFGHGLERRKCVMCLAVFPNHKCMRAPHGTCQCLMCRARFLFSVTRVCGPRSIWLRLGRWALSIDPHGTLAAMQLYNGYRYNTHMPLRPPTPRQPTPLTR